MEKHISEVNVGDKVILRNRSGRKICVVERLTKTQIVLKDGMGKYRKSDGYLVGRGDWDFSDIIPATEELIDGILQSDEIRQKRHKINNFIRKVKVGGLSESQLDIILDAINQVNDLDQ